MNNLTSFWQRIYFNIYRLLGQGPLIKKGKVITHKDIIGMRLVTTSMILLVTCIIIIVSNLLSLVVGYMLTSRLGNVFAFMSVLLVLPCIINYLLLWRNSKWVGYFERFNKEPAAEKEKWAWISFVVVLGIFLLLIWSNYITNGIETYEKSIKEPAGLVCEWGCCSGWHV